jgi:hypothetical protein
VVLRLTPGTDKPRSAWIAFAVQAVIVAVFWSAFLAIVAKHRLDGGFVLQVVVLALVLPGAVAWGTQRRKRRP